MPLTAASQPTQNAGAAPATSPAASDGQDYSHVQLDSSTFSPVAGSGATQNPQQAPQGPTISAQPKSSELDLSLASSDPMTQAALRMATPLARKVMDAVDKLREVENFTQEGRAEHPIQAKLGDVANKLEDFLFGNPEHGGMKTGFANNPVTASLIPGAEGEPAAAALLRQGGQAIRELPAALRGGTEAEQAPGLVKQIVKGEKVAQKPAEQALRTGAQAAGGKAANPSLRTVLEEPIDTISSQAKAAYRQVDEAAGTDFKALREKLENTEYQLRQLTETEEDVAKEAQLEKSRVAIMDKIDAAKKQAVQAGVDPKTLEQADEQFKQAGALKDLQAKIFKNPNIVAGNKAVGAEESINVNQAVKELQKLQDNTKFGAPRLEQAIGKQGAQALLKDMYAAQKAGVQAMTRQQWAARLAKAAAATGVGYGALHGILGVH